jgi:polar amino acid transport system permease protein
MTGVDLTFLWSNWGVLLLYGFGMTIVLTIVAAIFATLIGLTVGTLRWAKIRVISSICLAYVELVRNTPLLVQILFWYFSASFILPTEIIRWLVDFGLPFVAATIGISLYHGAFISEVIRAGLNAVPQGQYEAARSLGLGFGEMMRSVIMPQTLRIVLPSLSNEFVSLSKGTSLALAIGVTELSYQAKYIETYAFRGVEALMGATVLYLVLCLTIAGIGRLVSHALPSLGQETREV